MSLQEAAEEFRDTILHEKDGLEVNYVLDLFDTTIGEHLPVDDAEPVTGKWLRSVGFNEVPSDMGPTYDNHFEVSNSDNTLNLWNFNDKCWLINGFDSFSLKTRGDIRRLCAALGIELEEKP